MRYLKFTVASFSFAIAAFATAAEPYSGRFLGTGRPCYGSLTITAKTIAWQTPFSQCHRVTYRIMDRDSDRTTFQLTSTSRTCHYQVISLVHQSKAQPDIGWVVSGYHDESSYRDDKAANFTSYPPDMLSCYLVRDPGYPGPLRW